MDAFERPNATSFRPILTSDRRCVDVKVRPSDAQFLPETSAGRLYNVGRTSEKCEILRRNDVQMRRPSDQY